MPVLWSVTRSWWTAAIRHAEDLIPSLLAASDVLGTGWFAALAAEAGPSKAFMQAVHATRPGGHMGFVGVNYEVHVPGPEIFFAEIHLLGGPAPVRRFLPKLIDLIWNRKINPGKVFDLQLPLAQVAEGYRAMDERRAIKVLLWP